MLDVDGQKQLASKAAAAQVQNGEHVGLGTGSTATFFLHALAERVRAGLTFIGVPTSDATARLARELGLAVIAAEQCSQIDIDIDGADEVDPLLNLTKGLGGALLREKILAAAAARFVVIVDERKLVNRLGERARLPIEVIRFGWQYTAAELEQLGIETALRGGNQPFRTDEGHYILDCQLPDLADPVSIASHIKAITGVVEHGLFLNIATEVLVGRADGTVTRLTSQHAGGKSQASTLSETALSDHRTP